MFNRGIQRDLKHCKAHKVFICLNWKIVNLMCGDTDPSYLLHMLSHRSIPNITEKLRRGGGCSQYLNNTIRLALKNDVIVAFDSKNHKSIGFDQVQPIKGYIMIKESGNVINLQ